MVRFFKNIARLCCCANIAGSLLYTKMKSCIVASLIATAAAFSPAQQNSVSESSLQANQFASELGAQAPLGFWDPLKLSDDWDQAEFDRFRSLEIRHGRVAMLAVVGYLTTEAGIRIPGMEEVGSGFSAFDVADLPMEVRGVIPLTVFCIGCLEAFMRDVTGLGEFPGDYRNGLRGGFGWDQFDEKTKLKKRAIELNNGRAAQMGITGLIVHELIGESILP